MRRRILFLCLGLAISSTLHPLLGSAAAFSSQSTTTKNTFTTATNFATPTQLTFTSPSGATIPADTLSTIAIHAKGIGKVQLDGIQVVADFSGTIPGDLTIQAASILGMSAVVQSVTTTGTTATITLVQLSSTPLSPYSSTGEDLLLATIQFTSPASGTMTITPNNSLTKILESSTGTNLLSPQSPTTFSFQ